MPVPAPAPAPSPTGGDVYDVIVVGCGVAGGALSTVLAQDGHRVLCIERHLHHPHTNTLCAPPRIVGELLQPGGYAALTRLGLSHAVEGIDAQRIRGYAIFLRDRAECLSYHADGGDAPGEERVMGRSFHNGRFLKRLREMAIDAGVRLVEGNVIGLVEERGVVVGVRYTRAEGDLCSVRAKLTIACDGCGSALRKKAAARHDVTVYSKFHGLVLRSREIPFPNHGHVVLAHPSPVLFYPISAKEVRCLVDVPSSYRGDAYEYMRSVVAPQVPEMLRGPFCDALERDGSKMMPNRVMPAAADIVPGAILLGDSFNMRHPLTGGGMTVALTDVELLRELLADVRDLADTADVADKLGQFYERRKPMSTTINILANALYTLFCANDDPALEDMRSACLDYLSKGGRMSHDPMAMLGGLKPQRHLLLAHFFAVALYGCGKALLPFPTPARISRAWSIFRASFNIMKPLANAENFWPLSWLPLDSL